MEKRCGPCVRQAFNIMNAWELIKHKIRLKVGADNFDNWFGKTVLREHQGDVLCVAVPDEAVRAYIEQEFPDVVQSACDELQLGISRIRYEVGGVLGSNGHGAAAPDSDCRLNPKFTFENFVVGACNQFAHAAARAVVSRPAEQYNPLYIYGGVGMGKTHLMQAIGRALLEDRPGLRIVYTTAERFMYEMIASIKQSRMPLFHGKYRTADVLLVDDVQFLAGKDATQEEFFHTFNELHEAQKQIVLTSDAPPNQVRDLVERLRSRFSSGLTVDVQAPDLETKMAILEKKAEAEGIKLPDDVRYFLAARTKSNVRELEGALLKLAMQSSVTGNPITKSMALQALKHLVPNGEKRITLESIIKAVAGEYNLTPAQLKQKTNERRIARPRQVAMYLSKELTDASLPEIGRAFAGKHHTTVLHSIEVIEKLRQTDQEINRTIQKLMDSLQ